MPIHLRFPINRGSDQELLRQARCGDASARDELLRHYTGFIRQLVHRSACALDAQDAFEIGLEALNDAIQTYQPDKGSAFTTYATAVIRNRLADAKRIQGRTSLEHPFSSLAQDSCRAAAVEEQWCITEFEDPTDRMDLQHELHELTDILKAFGLTIANVLKTVPEHDDSRRLAIRLAVTLAKDSGLYQSTLLRHRLPVSQLAVKSHVNRKTIQRHKAYILFVALIWNSPMESIREYVLETMKRGDS